MSKAPEIIKSTGEREVFQTEKLEQSLLRAGAKKEQVDEIVAEISEWLVDGVTTKKIYTKAFNLLKKKRHSYAARYSLKKALMELGPTGYPFEYFVGQVFAIQGFDTKVGQIVQGQCVEHEVDVVATQNSTQYLVECKYYNTQSRHANVKVPLYIRSRVNDIEAKRKQLPEYNGFTFHGWIVTNTRFTSDALDFGKCSGLHLVSWNYPRGHSLKDMIDTYKMFPITVLTGLGKREKQQLMDKGIVLCRQLVGDSKTLHSVGLTDKKIETILNEVHDLTNGKKIKT
ncbi:MAG TPA: ATP cone domain-containing protein [Perlabentimonas sp.]|nr:ATP cone domain-containing protein [Bacteroidales bacterium]MDY0349479.1 ATP cone domain-containing protein [Tenuifilaceae bacterium]HZJ73299.1 ATP cone domain-containing protein [Perlabentimonas sp.]